MIIFIFLSLYIAIILQESDVMYDILASDYSIYIGSVLLISCFIATATNFKRFPFKLRYDLFASSALLIWFSYWPDFFRDGSPVFTLYPLYFALITALFSLFFITKRERIDEDALVFLQWLSDSGRFNPSVLMVGIMASLWFPEFFMLFPVLVTLWVVRYTLACCLDNE